MGYVSDQQGIINRYLREGNGWSLHLENTKRFIVEACEGRGVGSVVVLGSGWLLDVPYTELSAHFDKVFLVDIYHPRQIRKKVKKFSNITLVDFDITGGAVLQAYQAVKSYKRMKQKVHIGEFLLNPDRFGLPADIVPDLVFSVNILNQLDILLTDYLRKFQIYTEDELLELKKIIQTKHVGSLPEGKSCLITDFEENIYDESDALIGTNPLIFAEFPKAQRVRNWKWDFDSQKTYYKNQKTYFNVLAQEF